MSANKRVAINGFGRIGRAFFRHYCQSLEQGQPLPFEVVAINDSGDPEVLANLLEFDTNYGQASPFTVECYRQLAKSSNRVVVDNQWRDNGIDYLVECSGSFRNRANLQQHIEVGGAERVILGSPAYDDLDRMVVYGVNHTSLEVTDLLISNASCTTNALAVMLNPLLRRGRIDQLWVAETHGYTSDQNLLDHVHGDPRRARSAANNMIPTQTMGLDLVANILPDLQGRVKGYSMRVPLPVGACLDLTITLSECLEGFAPTVEKINQLYADHQSDLLGYNDRPLVSSDFIGRSESVIFDATQTAVMGEQIKLLAWFDNEWGYSRRLLDLLIYMSA